LLHDGSVSQVVFSPDGKKQLATASYDNTARLWDAATGQEVQRLHHDGPVNAVTFSPDGKQLATASDDKTARIWLWRPVDLINQLCTRLLHNLTWDEWHKYFEDEPYRKTCELLPVAPDYQEKGKQLVKEGKTVEALRMIQQLNAADPALKLDQEQTLQKWAAP
jgi:dipeptidyl aminopeptidase/acylaminoacyl peptidase